MAKNSSMQNVMEVIMASSDKNDLSRKYLEECFAFKDGDGYILRFK